MPRRETKTARRKTNKLDPAADFTKPVRRPKQARLPGTEDAAIQELEGLAEEYAEKRDQRQAIGKEEVELKNALLNAMHKNHKTTYHHGGVFIAVLTEKEKVKVRISKGGKNVETKDDEADAPGGDSEQGQA
jgi:hypothetical protein